MRWHHQHGRRKESQKKGAKNKPRRIMALQETPIQKEAQPYMKSSKKKSQKKRGQKNPNTERSAIVTTSFTISIEKSKRKTNLKIGH